MDEFTIWCTEEQTKLALELGASINTTSVPWYNHPFDYKYWAKVNIQGNFYSAKIPTAEQMIGWLEGQGGIEEITVCKTGMWIWGKNHTLIDGGLNYSSRQESSLAAIDAALEYLKTKC